MLYLFLVRDNCLQRMSWPLAWLVDVLLRILSLPAFDRLIRTSEARAVLLVVLIMCILSHPGKT